MLTDYERYQLEWMIDHGHSLDELMAELTYYQNDLEATRGVNLTVSDVFDAWTSDRGFASLENDVITKDMIRAGIEHGVIRFEANPDPNDPWKTVCAIGNGWFYHVDTTDIPPDEYIRINSRNVDMVVDEIYDELNSTVKSDYHDDFKRYLAVLNEEHHGGTNSLTGIPFDINETMENGGAYYNPERGIVIASFLLEQTSPRIEAYYGYTPYALASLIGKNADVTVDSDVMDIQDILADPSLPRRFDHELASFDSVEELIASRWSPTGAGWLDMSGHDGLASAMGALGIKQTDNVREWYALAFPGDELAVAINPSLTFDNAIAAVPTGTASTPHSATQQTPSCASASSRSCATVTATPTMRSMIVGSMSRPCPPRHLAAARENRGRGGLSLQSRGRKGGIRHRPQGLRHRGHRGRP